MTIILVHGLWGAADHWHGVIESLKSLGVTDVVTVELPLRASEAMRMSFERRSRKSADLSFWQGRGSLGWLSPKLGLRML